MMKSNVTAIQIRNTANKSYIIPKNFKVRHLRDYDEKDYFMTTSKNCYLTMTFEKFLNIRKILTNQFIDQSMETVLPNKITMYENRVTIEKLIVVTEKTSKI